MPHTQTEFAAHIGKSQRAVAKMIATGRLAKALVMVNGRAMITDLEAAAREVAATTQARVDYDRDPTPAPAQEDEESPPPDLPEYKQARAEFEGIRVEIARIDLEVKRKNFVPRKQVLDEAAAFRVAVRTKWMGAAQRFRRFRPGLPEDAYEKLIELNRMLLEELAKEEQDLADDDQDSDGA